MEDQERTEQTFEEDKDEVEAHSNKASHKDSVKAARDEGDDVEGHMHKASHKATHKY